jgi:hypothetical protein
MTKARLRRIRAAVSYDAATGIFHWKISQRGHRRKGDVAGSNTRGYWRIKIDQTAYAAGRLAWMIHFGKEPNGEIDHINGDPPDNRIANLREASRVQNCANIKGRGVRFEPDRRKWLARITVGYKQINLGRFDTEQAARTAYLAACKRYRGAFARVG